MMLTNFLEYVGAITIISLVVIVFGILPLWFIGRCNAKERKKLFSELIREYLERN